MYTLLVLLAAALGLYGLTHPTKFERKISAEDRRHLAEAEDWYDFLCEGIAEDSFERFVGCIRKELELGGFSLADINVTEEDIKELRDLNAKEFIRRLIRDVHDPMYQNNTYLIELFIKALSEAAHAADPRVLIELAEEGTVKIVVFAHPTTTGIFGEETAKHLARGIAPRGLLALLDMELIEIDGILCDF